MNDILKENVVDINSVPKSEFIDFDWVEDDFNNINFEECKYLIIWHHRTKSKNFDNLPDVENLEYLKINWSGSKSFEGLGRYKKLKRIEFAMCNKLETMEGIQEVNPELDFLEITNAQKLTEHKLVSNLKKLRVLRFNKCGNIQNLEFLSEMPTLEEFRFAYSNVVDGDLSQIAEHKKIKSIGMINKRHYSHKENELEKILSAK